MWLLALLLLIRTDMVVEGDLARQLVPATPAPTSGRAESRIIYLNHTGATLRPGLNDSIANTSSIVEGPVQIPPWNTDAQTWAETVACFTELYSRFDVEVVDTDPGDVQHIEAIFGGTASLVGLPANVAGVSPFATDCSIVEDSIVFTFTGTIHNITAREACEIMAQEVAHSYGLDHELLAADPMSYLVYGGKRAFQDETAACGEHQPRPCGITASACRANQNSVQLLFERLGPASGAPAGDPSPRPGAASDDLIGGCSSGGPSGLLGVVLGLGLVALRRRR